MSDGQIDVCTAGGVLAVAAAVIGGWLAEATGGLSLVLALPAVFLAAFGGAFLCQNHKRGG